MQIFYVILLFLGVCFSSYLIGSISNAIIISKYFYHIDISKVGSKNAGGTNVGRYCGKKAAYIVIALDTFKTILAMWSWFFIIKCTPLNGLIYEVSPYLNTSFFYYTAGLFTCIGHRFSIFEGFKGGKGVACYGGFCLGTNYILAIIGLSTLLIVFFIKKKVSIGSIIGVIVVLISSLVFSTINHFYPYSLSWMYYFNDYYRMDPSFIHTLYIFIFTFLIIYFHIPNIKRIIKNEEPETHFKKN